MIPIPTPKPVAKQKPNRYAAVLEEAKQLQSKSEPEMARLDAELTTLGSAVASLTANMASMEASLTSKMDKLMDLFQQRIAANTAVAGTAGQQPQLQQ